MNKFWAVVTLGANISAVKNNDWLEGMTSFDTKEAAQDYAKRMAAENSNKNYQFVIVEAIGVTKVPVPDINIVEIK